MQALHCCGVPQGAPFPWGASPALLLLWSLHACPVSYAAKLLSSEPFVLVSQGPPVVCFKLATLLEALFPEEYRARAAVLAQQKEQIVQSAEAVEVRPHAGCLRCGLDADPGICSGVLLLV